MRKTIIFTAALLSCFFIIPAFSQSPSDDSKKEAAYNDAKKADGEIAKTDRESILQKKERYQHAAENQLHKLEQKIKRFHASAEKAGQKMKQKMQAAGSELNNKKEAAKEKLRDLKTTGEDKWDKMKSEMDSLIKDLEKSYNHTVSRFNAKKQN